MMLRESHGNLSGSSTHICRNSGESAYRDHPDQVLHIDASPECTDDPLDRPVFPQEGQAGLADAKQGGAIGGMGH